MTWTRLSTGTIVVAAFWAIAVLGASMLPMTDPDTWWHIRAGDEIIATREVPRVDTWSIAGAGRPWVSQDWASNVLMAALHGAGEWGPSFVSFAYGLIAVASFVLLWNAIAVREPGIGWLSRVAWLLFGLVLAAPVLGARVQVVDLLFAAAVINVLWRWLIGPRTWHLVAIPLIALAWVNLHAGWPLLFLLSGAVIVGELVDGWLRRGPAPRRGIRWLLPLVAALGVSLFVLPLNPNGVAIYTYPFETLGIGALSSFIGEWQPASLTAPAGQLLLAFALLGILPALLFAHRRLRVADALILLGLAFMAVTAVRFLLVAGPIGAAIVGVALAPVIAASSFGERFSPTIERLGRLPRGPRATVNAALVAVIALAAVAAVALRIGPAGQQAAIDAVMPSAAVEWLQDENPGQRVFNRYEWGGYLGLQRPDRLIFIDGRADVYGDAIIRNYVEVISVNVDPQAYLEGFEIDHVLFPRDSTLGAWLEESSGWRRAYDDEVASVWVRD